MRTIKKMAICSLIIFFIMACSEVKKSIVEVTGADGTVYSSIQDACRAKDFTAAYKILDLIEGSEEDEDYVFNAEVIYLVSQNTEEASNRVLYLLAEYQNSGMPVSPGGEYGSNFYEKVKVYLESISRYNNRCNNVLTLAISQGNKSLARKVVELFKQNIDVDFEDSDSHYIRISKKGYNNTDKDAAQAKYDEAVSSGVFK